MEDTTSGNSCTKTSALNIVGVKLTESPKLSMALAVFVPTTAILAVKNWHLVGILPFSNEMPLHYFD